MFIRTVKVPSSNGTVNEYVRIVESYRDEGKVRQRTVSDLGRKDILTAMLPKLQRVLLGAPTPIGEDADQIEVVDASTWGPVLAVRALFDELGLWTILDQLLPRVKKGPSYADRAFVLLANRLTRPASEHGLARWLETDFVCDRRGRRFVPQWKRRGRVQVDHRQLGAWYRTLDVLIRAKDKIEVALFQRLRDLFSLKPDLVLFDITSTYFEGAGPKDFAKHGYSRDGKPQNVQVVIGVVMVAGWPIAHYVWPGNRLDVTTVREMLGDLCTRFDFQRVIFVGDRGMVSAENINAIEEDGHGYLVGLKRRRNAELDAWLQQVDEMKWIDCPVGITAREKKENPPRTRVQEIATGDETRRVFVIDSDERRKYEQAKRTQAMERTRVKLDSVQQRVADGKLTDAARIGAAAQRALGEHGQRYYTWKFDGGCFTYTEDPLHFEREKRLEGRYVISTSEKTLTALDAVAMYKQLMEVELFFKWIKQNLRIKAFYGASPNAVRTQVWISISVYVLVAILKKELGQGRSLSAILQILSITLFEKNQLSTVLNALGEPEEKTPSHKQLTLFDI